MGGEASRDAGDHEATVFVVYSCLKKNDSNF